MPPLSHLLLSCLLGCGLAAPALAQPADAPPLRAVGEVQGAGARSPLLGQAVSVEGVVTATMRNPDGFEGRDGWFLQDSGDGDPATSDALFVPDAGGPPVGTRVRVRGTVVELDAGQGSLTALRPEGVAPLGDAALPRPVRLAALPADWERHEGMRIRIASPLTVAGTHRLDREGELLVHAGDRLRAPTDATAPGAAARALAEANAARRLRLDDGSLQERPETVWYLPEGAPRAGSRLRDVEGVLDQRGGGYVLQLTRVPTVRAAPRPTAPKVGGDVRVAALNLENFFNGDGRGGAFPTPRGARTPAEFAAQRARLVATLVAMDPDIAALMELENDGDGPQSAQAELVAALNREAAARGQAPDWRAVPTAGVDLGDDQIRVGLIHRSGRVTAVGTAASLVDDLFGRRSRPPLAQSYRAGEGPVFTVAVNHFKSKGCGDAAGADADQGDGQGCWNAARTLSAQRLDAWLRSDPTGSGSDLAMIVGDLNAYTQEDPLRALAATGWRDAFAGQAMPYSYVFNGEIGRLDHALLSPALAPRLAGAAEWHTNADEPTAAGYRERPDGEGPWRSSDHDPLLLGLRLRRP